MKSLNKKITSKFFLTEDGYSKLEFNWKKSIHSGKNMSFESLLLYMIVRGKDWTKCFTPSKNSDKNSYRSLYLAFNYIKTSLYPSRLRLTEEQYNLKVQENIKVRFPEFSGIITLDILDKLFKFLDLKTSWTVEEVKELYLEEPYNDLT